MSAPAVVLSQPAACPAGNLLEAAKVNVVGHVEDIERLNDDVAAVEGDPWNSDYASVMQAQGAAVVFDLGERTSIDAFYIQADHDDTMLFSVSDDGDQYTGSWTMPFGNGKGVRSRAYTGANAIGRYLKVSLVKGDGVSSIAEVQAFCRKPQTWPPEISRKATLTWWIAKFLRDSETQAKMVFAILGLLVFASLMVRDKQKRWLGLWGVAPPALAMLLFASWQWMGATHTKFFPKWGVYIVAALLLAWLFSIFNTRKDQAVLGTTVEKGALLCVAFASVVAFTNLGAFHKSRVVHYWDMYHYYVGSKYFEENRYDGLYECTIAADLHDRGRADMRDRKIRDLRDNKLSRVTPQMVSEANQRCEKRLSGERWEAFRQDARLFRSYMGDKWWKDMLMDHGYNPSPVWNMFGSAASNMGWRELVPPSELAFVRTQLRQLDVDGRAAARRRFAAERKAHQTRMLRFAAVDAALYLAVFALIGWAFGLRACALAMLVWGVGYPWSYFWTGGSFGRVPWLFMATASVCLLKRGRPFLAGAALTWSMLLRVFPGALIVGIALKIGRGLLARELSRSHAMFIAGCTVALVVLVFSSLPSAGGFKAYPEFVQNSLKHKSTPLTNHMGLPTLLSYHPDKVGRRTKDPSLSDPWTKWKEGRKQTLNNRRWVWYVCLLSLIALLAYGGRYFEDWALVAAGVLMIIGIFELTSYYYSFVILMVPLALRRLRYVVVLLFTILLGQALKFIVGWYDEQHQWETLILLVALLYIYIDALMVERSDSRLKSTA